MKKLVLVSIFILFGVDIYSQNNASELIKSGKDFYGNAQYMYAISKFSRVFKTFPTEDETYEAYIYRAMCKRELKDFEDAIEDLNEACNIFPDSTRSYFLRAEYKEIIKDFPGASGDYSRILNLEPNNPDAYFLRGTIQKKLNNKDKACLDFKKAKENGYNKDMKTLEKELNKCD